MATTITATAAWAQYRRNYSATVTGANTNYTTPTNSALLVVAGPDGSLVTHMASLPRATITQTQMQYFLSKDGGTTFSLLTSGVIQALTVTQTSTTMTGFSATQIDTSVLSETNPIPLGGMTSFGGTITPCGTTSGAVNAQLLPFAQISALVKGQTYDFEAGLTNTAGATIQIGTTAATTVVRDTNGAALSAGDITAGYRYRIWYDGSNLRLIITDRLYVAAGVALAGGITTTAQVAEF